VLETASTLRALVEEEKAEYENARLRGVRVPFTAISNVRRRLAIAKSPFVIEHLKTLLESEQKLVCMAHHHEVIDLIANAFDSDAVTVDGRSSLRYRQAMIDRFQNDPSCRLLVGGVQVAGTGINLTAANVVVFAELDWTPGVLSQAEDRLHRIGQTRNVLIQHVVLDHSLDANLIQGLTKKQRIIAAISTEVCANG
jgi:SNF2 family DNA or RNA helicase